jgi:hypothetical protein
MSIMKFIVYCNGIMFFHNSVDCSGHTHNAYFVYGVSTMFQNLFIFKYVLFLIYQCVSSIHRKSTKLSSSLV